MLTQDLLIEMFDYDPLTGWFTNRYSRGRAAAGSRAGSETGHGYRRIIIGYNKYYEHHLAWLYVYGVWPGELDHADGNASNNRIANLRECSRSENKFNARTQTGQSGLSGAYLDLRNSQWYSKIQVGGQQKFLGNFDSPEEAHAAYLKAREKIAGEFAHHNRPLRRV
jgi:hypothetical protein